MKINTRILILIKTLVLPIVFITACVEFEQVSPIPEIKYQDFELLDGFDTLGNPVKFAILEFNFIDGDADFGVYPEIASDTLKPDLEKFNLIMTIYDKIDGKYKLKTIWNKNTNNLDTLTLKQTIKYDPKLDRVGQNQTIKGNITAIVPLEKWQVLTDTFRIEFYIRDRALNKSNVEYSDDSFIEQ